MRESTIAVSINGYCTVLQESSYQPSGGLATYKPLSRILTFVNLLWPHGVKVLQNKSPAEGSKIAREPTMSSNIERRVMLFC